MDALMVIATVLINGAVTWGVVRTELKYLRRDIDQAHKRLDRLDEHLMRGA